MAWYAVFKNDNGELVSVSTVVNSENIPAGLAFAPLPHRPDWTVERWDQTTRALVSTRTVQIIDVTGNVRTITLDREPTDQDTYDTLYPFVSKLQLRRLLTLEERIALDNAELSPALDDQYKAIIKTVKLDFQVADFISLQDPLTVQMVNLLETLGLLAEGRAAQILAGRLP